MLEQSRLTRDNVTSKREETHRERQTAGTEREREREPDRGSDDREVLEVCFVRGARASDPERAI